MNGIGQKKEESKKQHKRALEVPAGIISGFVLEIYSGKEAVLTGKLDVLELGDTVLKLKCGEHEISFGGSGLNIVYYTNDGIKISGKISSVEME